MNKLILLSVLMLSGCGASSIPMPRRSGPNPVGKNLITGTDRGGIAWITCSGKEVRVKAIVGLSRHEVEISYLKNKKERRVEIKRDKIEEGELRVEGDRYFYRGDRGVLFKMLSMCEFVLDAREEDVDVENFIK